MGQQTEGIGIALEVSDVAPELGTHLALQLTAVPLDEKGLDSLFAAVAKGWIAQVVGQTGGGDDLSDLLKERVLQFGVLPDQLLGHVIAQRHADTGHLQRMCQTVVYEDTARKGEYLGLVLQTTEWG